MKQYRPVVGILGALALSACGGTASDPKTLSKDDLNPPYELMSVTEDSQMILQWRSSNTEEDVVGYNVYVVPKPLSELQALLTASTVSDYDLATQAVRRCKDTATLFAEFGFNADDDQAQKDCDDFAIESKEEGTGWKAPWASLSAADEDPPSRFVKCVDSSGNDLGSTLLSVDMTKAKDAAGNVIPTDPLQRVDKLIRCYVKDTTALSDAAGTQGFTNGQVYTAFVVAVAGEDADEVSYTSNFVEDRPTKYTTVSVSLGSAETVPISLDATSGVATAEDAVASDCDPVTIGGTVYNGCRISTDFTAGQLPNNSPALFLVEDEQGSKERSFLVSLDPVYVARRAPGTSILRPNDVPLKYDPARDATASATRQYLAGTAQTIYPGSLFDFVYVNNSQYFYGKIFFDSVATDAASAAGTGTKTITAKVAFQVTGTTGTGRY